MRPIKTCLVCALAILTLLSSVAFAADYAGTKQNAVNKNAKDALTNAQKKIDLEAAEGVKLTYRALSEVKNNELDKAKETLLAASKDIDTATKKGKDQLPIDAFINIASGVDTPEQAKSLMGQAKLAIDQNNPQLARALLMPLIDEIDVGVTSVPLVIYKSDIDKAILALDRGDREKAGKSISDALGRLVTEIEVIPITVVMANDFLKEAKEIDKTHPEETLALLRFARSELELNGLLGYGYSGAYNKEIGNIERKALSKRFEETEKEIVQNISFLEEKIKEDISKEGLLIKEEISAIKKIL